MGRSPGSGAGGAGSTAIPPRPRAARGRHALLRPLNGRLCSPLALALFVPRTIGLFTGPGRRKTRRRKNRLCRGVPASGEAFFGVFHPPQHSVGSEELSAPEVRAWCPVLPRQGSAGCEIKLKSRLFAAWPNFYVFLSPQPGIVVGFVRDGVHEGVPHGHSALGPMGYGRGVGQLLSVIPGPSRALEAKPAKKPFCGVSNPLRVPVQSPAHTAEPTGLPAKPWGWPPSGSSLTP